MLKKLVLTFFDRLGYQIVPKSAEADSYFDVDPTFFELYDKCRSFTMTSMGKMHGVYNAIAYIEKYDIPGDIVECGVWRGGSAMMAACSLRQLDSTDRHLYLYDTYDGMPLPGEQDVDAFEKKASDLLAECERRPTTSDDPTNYWARVTIEEVRKNMLSTRYPEENIKFIKGKVEETIPGTMPERISVLRIDTDWFASTDHILRHLFPRLVPGGVLILDDYGYWKGARKAVDGYFDDSKAPILLNRLNDGRIAIKITDAA
jgi:O-methyltransferase